MSFTVVGTFLVLVFHIAQHLPGGEQFVSRAGVVRAAQPMDISLLRTPLSLFVPALDLPVWGALAQVFVVFGIAELVLGLRMTLFVGYAGTLAGTFFTRLGVARGSGHLFHLPAWFAQVRDAGPSAAVVALVLCVAWRYRAWFTGVTVVVMMVGEAIALPNLAGLEHLAALAAAALIASVDQVVRTFYRRISEVIPQVSDLAVF
ncbi:hypothetical protein [Kitasatospora sp. MAP5-34]|uniref:hypothetical protein n=1 Tax=Kitasatospora sp. MAP5-34 TaxID=3035102 RepID=UPI002476E0BC|nr:hypothetical protein [Kitasatospora sp. MAP5-34]